MPQADLPAVGDSTNNSATEPDPTPPDYAPDSFFLSKDAELDWLDRNAFMERKDSGKGAPPQPLPSYSGNLKKSRASIIGLPRRQKTNYKEADRTRMGLWVLPKRSEKETEPSSPKVSCMGRVRSKKSGKHMVATGTGERSGRVKPTRVWRKLGCLFGHRRGEREDERRDGEVAAKVETQPEMKGELPAVVAVEVEPPQLGAVQRFTSGRRSDAWAADVGVHIQVES